MAVTIQVKRGSRATLPVLALGEYGLTTDTKELFIGGPEGVNIQIAVLDNFIKFCPAALRYTFHLGEGQGENG